MSQSSDSNPEASPRPMGVPAEPTCDAPGCTEPAEGGCEACDAQTCSEHGGSWGSDFRGCQNVIGKGRWQTTGPCFGESYRGHRIRHISDGWRYVSDDHGGHETHATLAEIQQSIDAFLLERLVPAEPCYCCEKFGRPVDGIHIVADGAYSTSVPCTCATCIDIGGGMGPSHNGSPRCESGSIASGGNRAHCTCDTCF